VRLRRPVADAILPTMESRVAVLEQIARTQTASLERIERRMDAMSADQWADFRWLLGIMAHGFHWL
jgi:hypothetical protein